MKVRFFQTGYKRNEITGWKEKLCIVGAGEREVKYFHCDMIN